FGAEVEILRNLWVGADVIAASGVYLRGDDANHQSRTDAYAILNLQARYRPIPKLELWARVDNATNARYVTGGAVNFNAFANPIAAQRFVAPGSPIGAWGGARVSF
ncbi:MAG TPA: TonB-dependent receptor, partial [Methylomirabilota bacterium]